MSKNLIYLTLTVVVLGGLLFIFKPVSKTVKTTVSQAQTKTFELVVKNRKLVAGPEKITVTEGDTIVIKVTSDEVEELHLHGYDKSVDLEKDKQAELKVTANITGSFAYELEKSQTDFGLLEVQPK